MDDTKTTIPPMVTIKQEVQVDSSALWSEVFGAYPTYWGWTKVHFIEGDWDKPGKAKVSIVDIDYEEGDAEYPVGEKVLTVEDIAEAISTLGFGWEDLDSTTSDAILQQAVLGEVTFS